MKCIASVEAVYHVRCWQVVGDLGIHSRKALTEDCIIPGHIAAFRPRLHAIYIPDKRLRTCK